MDYNEFAERVGLGEEFNFYLNDFEYWISNNSEGYYLTKCISQSFTTVDDLFNKSKVDGKNIQDLWSDIREQLGNYNDYDELIQKVRQGDQPYFNFGEHLYMIENNQLQLDVIKSTPRKSLPLDHKMPSKKFTLVQSISQDFKTADELLRDARIDGKSILELWKYLCI